MTSLSRMLSRLAALALLAVILGATWLYVIEPVAAHVRRVNESIEDNRQLIDRLAWSIGAPGQQAARIEALQRQIEKSSHYLRAETEALAAAAMREHLRHILSEGGVEVKSFQTLPTTETIGLTRVSVRVVLRGGFDELIVAFFHLETEKPYIFIDELRIQKAAMRRRRRNRDQKQPAKLSVVFQLSGFLPPKAEQ